MDRGEDAAWRGKDEEAFAVGRGPIAVLEVQDLERVRDVKLHQIGRCPYGSCVSEFGQGA